MSRAYRISMSESVSRVVRVTDGVRTQLELLDVLPVEATCELLAQELAERGFERDGEEMVRRDEDGLELRVAVGGDAPGQVTVRQTRESQLDFEVELARRTFKHTESQDRQQMQERLDQAVEQRQKDEESQLSAEVAETLERKLRDLRRELDQIATRVTAEGLKVRAGQLGEIREISEDPETGSLTIKVRV
ncbi:MAG: hypothetical protein AAGC55_08735 [Myxococcota bacterium]